MYIYICIYMYIHLYMTQAHEYAMVGLGACRDATGKWSKNALKANHASSWEPYTLADCQLQCDVTPNCQGFTADYGRQNRFCELWSDADTANGDSEYQCWSKGNLKVATALRLLFWNRLC